MEAMAAGGVVREAPVASADFDPNCFAPTVEIKTLTGVDPDNLCLSYWVSKIEVVGFESDALPPFRVVLRFVLDEPPKWILKDPMDLLQWRASVQKDNKVQTVPISDWSRNGVVLPRVSHKELAAISRGAIDKYFNGPNARWPIGGFNATKFNRIALEFQKPLPEGTRLTINAVVWNVLYRSGDREAMVYQ